MNKRIIAWLLLCVLCLSSMPLALGETLSATVNTKKDPLNLWNAPDGSTCLVRIPKGETITILEKGDKWSKAEHDGKTGYVRTEYLVFLDKDENNHIHTTENANIHDGVEYVVERGLVRQVITDKSEITIPLEIKIIGDGDVFGSSPNLKAIYVANNHPDFESVDGVLFNNTDNGKKKRWLIKYPQKKEGEVYEIPEDTYRVHGYAFAGNESIKEIQVPIGVNRIEEYAFKDCINLAVINIPNETSRGAELFSGCQEEVRAGKALEYLTDEQKEFLVASVIRYVKQSLKNPNSLQLHSVSFCVYPMANMSWGFVKIDYSAMNSLGGYTRETAYYRAPYKTVVYGAYVELANIDVSDVLEMKFSSFSTEQIQKILNEI